VRLGSGVSDGGMVGDGELVGVWVTVAVGAWVNVGVGVAGTKAVGVIVGDSVIVGEADGARVGGPPGVWDIAGLVPEAVGVALTFGGARWITRKPTQ